MLSGSSLSKNQLYIDAMLCSYWRERFASDSGPVYIWADSSPQAGANWLLSMVLSIRADELQETAKAARYLASSAGIIASEGEMEEDFDTCLRRRSDAGRIIASNMVVHSQIPVALGSGAAGVEHTLRCIVHKCFVETSSTSGCRRFFSRVRACCVDMGVEFHLSDANGIDATDLMPVWMRAAVEDEEVDPEDLLGPEVQKFLMPLSILSAGVVHIVNNIQKDVDGNLPGWKTWLPGYKAIAYLLHKVLRPTTTEGSHQLRLMFPLCLGVTGIFLSQFVRTAVRGWRAGQGAFPTCPPSAGLLVTVQQPYQRAADEAHISRSFVGPLVACGR